MDEGAFASLLDFLRRVPAIGDSIGSGDEDGPWWVQFTIDIDHPLAWHVVQELGHVVNDPSLDERLPASFHPVSPPPYLNGGPDDLLSSVIESRGRAFRPGSLAKRLEGRLPNPVDDLEPWRHDESLFIVPPNAPLQRMSASVPAIGLW